MRKIILGLCLILSTPAMAGNFLGNDSDEWLGGRQSQQRFNDNSTFQQPPMNQGNYGRQCVSTMCPPMAGGMTQCFCTMWQ